MIKKILYPTDFSIEAKRALEFVKCLKNAGGKEVVVLHVIDQRAVNDLSRFAMKDVDLILKDMQEKAGKELVDIEKELKDNGYSVKIRVEKGDPFREILRVEGEEKASLIVVGSQGKADSFQTMLLGSVSYNLVRKSSCPVLVVKR